MRETDITLKSRGWRITRILKRTTAEGFKKLRVEDVIYFSMAITATKGASSGGLYATYITVECPTKAITVRVSQNMLIRYLQIFELEELTGMKGLTFVMGAGTFKRLKEIEVSTERCLDMLKQFKEEWIPKHDCPDGMAKYLADLLSDELCRIQGTVRKEMKV